MPADRFVRALPRAMKARFESLGGYVEAVLDEGGLRPHISTEDRRAIKLIIFSEVLEDFFRQGSRAAKMAVDQFEALELSGFQIGQEVFAGRNDAVTRGDRLANALAGDAFANDETSSETLRVKGLRARILEVARSRRG